jgi:outer membrane protein assembly factor BamB
MSRSGRSPRGSLALLATLVALLASSFPRTAQAATPTLALSPAIGPPTTVATASGSGFASAEQIALGFDDRALERFTALADGTFIEAFTVPASATPGQHTVSARGTSSGTATATFLVRTDWPTPRFDPEGTGFNPYETVLSPTSVGGLQLAWSRMGNGAMLGTPIVVGGTVYVAGQVDLTSEAELYAFDATTGALLWRRTLSGEPASDMTVANGMLYVSFLTGHVLRAFNASSGVGLWSFPGPTFAPTVVGGVVYAADDLHSLWALDATTGQKLWVARVPFGGYGTGVAVSDGRVYAGGHVAGGLPSPLYAYDAATGALLWRTRTGGQIQGTPAVVGNKVFVGSGDHLLYAVNASTGHVRWTAPTGSVIASSAAVADGRVFVGSADHSEYAFDARTGQQLWATPTGGNITAIQASIVANGVVYVGSNDNSEHAFDATTGEQLWSYQASEDIHKQSLVNGTLYVTSTDGYLYAFRLP